MRTSATIAPFPFCSLLTCKLSRSPMLGRQTRGLRLSFPKTAHYELIFKCVSYFSSTFPSLGKWVRKEGFCQHSGERGLGPTWIQSSFWFNWKSVSSFRSSGSWRSLVILPPTPSGCWCLLLNKLNISWVSTNLVNMILLSWLLWSDKQLWVALGISSQWPMTSLVSQIPRLCEGMQNQSQPVKHGSTQFMVI